jgi:hypothetical protein
MKTILSLLLCLLFVGKLLHCLFKCCCCHGYYKLVILFLLYITVCVGWFSDVRASYHPLECTDNVLVLFTVSQHYLCPLLQLLAKQNLAGVCPSVMAGKGMPAGARKTSRLPWAWRSCPLHHCWRLCVVTA